MMHWDQPQICKWADETFGKSTNLNVALRARKELNELILKLEEDDNHPGAPEEVADVVIVIVRVCENMGADYMDEVHKKMEINCKRMWTLDGNGNGQHV
jgi:NTP pyrophosphatase (non-canonical NTP hydrolase)